MKTLPTPMIVLVAMAFTVAGCSSDTGSDAITKRQAQGGSQTSSCTAKCHNGSSSIAPDPLVTNGTGTHGKHIAHVQNTGIPCEKCHANYINAATHMNGQIDTGPAVNVVFFDSTNPPPAQFDKNAGPPVAGICSNLACHGPDTLDWYGTGAANFQNCGSCHSSAIGTRRRVTGAQGDFGGNALIVSHHVTTTGDPAREQCLVCHDQSTHTAGTVRLRIADTNASIVHNPLIPATLEPFCLGCHDVDGAMATFITGGTPTAPFNDGSTLGVAPYPYAKRIAGSWAKSYGHGPNGGHDAGSRLTCLGTGQPGTGCHGSSGAINAHGSAHQVLAARNFTYAIGSTYNEADYDLCYTCHAAYPGFTKEDVLAVKFGGILDSDYGMLTGPSGTDGFNPPYYTDQYGVPKGLTTLFADHNESGSPFNNPGFWGTPNMNLHWFHLGMQVTSLRGTGTSSRLICVNCHDVHGASNPYGATYDEMGYLHVAPDGTNLLGMMNDDAYSTSLLNSYPTYCAFNCHPIQDLTRAWFYPIVE